MLLQTATVQYLKDGYFQSILSHIGPKKTLLYIFILQYRSNALSSFPYTFNMDHQLSYFLLKDLQALVFVSLHSWVSIISSTVCGH